MKPPRSLGGGRRGKNVPVGTDRYGAKSMQRVHFVSARFRTGETAERAIGRGEEVMHVVPLPEGVRVAWEPTSDWDPETGKETPTGVRSFLVRGQPILTNSDVVEAATAVDRTSRAGAGEVYVAITLAPEAAERFRLATRENINRRIAILLDGRVNSAPVVRSEIGGGRISITMGAADPEHQLATARALADGLRQD